MTFKNISQVFTVALFVTVFAFGIASHANAEWGSYGGSNSSTGTCCTTSSNGGSSSSNNSSSSYTAPSDSSSSWSSYGGSNSTTGTCCTTSSNTTPTTPTPVYTDTTSGSDWYSYGGSNSTTGTCCSTSNSTYTPTYLTPTYVSEGCMYGCGGTTYTPPTYVQPTCAISASNTSISAGETVTIGWSSTNASSGNISNLGSYLPTSGSRQVTLYNTTTFNGSFYGNGGTASCSVTVVVQPKAPTCTITGPDTATPGQTITLNWNSTNSTRGDISNLGTNLPVSGSHSFVINNTTTFYGTFYGTNGQTGNCSKTVMVNQYCPAGYSGSYPNCYPPQNNNLSCTISINNYNNGNNNYFAPNTAVTLSWNSNGASWGSINNGFGSVSPSGSRTIYPTQTTTYTGTFYNGNGQQVTCSATVYINGYVPPQNPNTPFVTLSAVPYTGLDLGPVGTALYWAFLAFWCALAAYLIVVKKVQNSVYGSLKAVLFGSSASHSAVAHSAPHASYNTHVAHVETDKTDDFILSQISRNR